MSGPPVRNARLDAYPEAPRAALSALLDAVAPLAPEPAALVVYGSLARGEHRAGESDVNLAVVLHDARPETLSALAAPLRAAFRRARVQPLILTRDELPRLTDVFPIKLADIVAAHDVLLGEDPFTGLVIEREHLRLRLEQQLRNHLLRLRRHAIFAGDDPRELGRALYASAGALGFELGTLLELSGAERPRGLQAVLQAAAARFELDRATLDALARLRRGEGETDATPVFAGLLRVLEGAVEHADRLETR